MSIPPVHAPPMIVFTRKDGTKEIFIRHEELGHGGFAYVYRVTQQYTNKEYAVKVISKQFLNTKGKETLDKLRNELIIQRSLNHPNIVRSKVSFSDELNYYIVLEYCPGKSIREYLRKSEHGYLSEPETRKILRDVVRGLVYLHSKNIIHHDIKLENFIIGANGKVKIADFGLSTILKGDDIKQFSICGTTNYLSPEILNKEGHDFKVDIWAIGVAAFIMLTGQPPFGNMKKEIVYERIKSADYFFPSSMQISIEAKSFIKSIFRIDPMQRPTAIELLNQPFLTKFDTELIDFYRPNFVPQKVQSSTPIQLYTNNNNNILQSSLKMTDSYQVQDSRQILPTSQKVRSPTPSQITQKVLAQIAAQNSQKILSAAASQNSQKMLSATPSQSSQKVISTNPSHSSQKVLSANPSQSSQKVLAAASSQNSQKVRSPTPTQSSQKVLSATPSQTSQKVRSPTPSQSSQKARSPSQSSQKVRSPSQSSQKVRSATPSSQKVRSPTPSQSSQKLIDDKIEFNSSKPPPPPSSPRKVPRKSLPPTGNSGSQSARPRSSSVSSPRKSRQQQHHQSSAAAASDLSSSANNNNNNSAGNSNAKQQSESRKSDTIRRNSSAFSAKNSSQIPTLSRKNFVIPNYFVTKFCLHGDDVGYLLGNGTVGVCFKETSRIVMDPQETFVQYYKNYDSSFDVINLSTFSKKKSSEKKEMLQAKISLALRFAKSLKKSKSSQEIVSVELDPSVPLYHVKYFVTESDSFLFKFSDKNIQVNFSDHSKMIIFWNTKKLCFFRNITEKCCLLDLNDVANMSSNSVLRQKFKYAKLMLSDLGNKVRAFVKI